MSRRRLLLMASGGVLVLVAGALWLLTQNLDGLVKRAIESYGSETAGTEVRITEVRIFLGEGRGTLRGLTVANPPGYSPSPLFTLNDITLVLDTLSLTAAVPVIDELRIGATAFRYELDAGGHSNLGILQKNMKGSAKSGGGNQAKGAEKRLKIKRLVMADGEATLELGSLDIGRATVKVPGVTLTDLGGDQGLTPRELSQIVLNALGKNLEKSVAVAGLQRLLRGKEGKKFDQAIRGLLNR
jgi:hypothetical protein